MTQRHGVGLVDRVVIQKQNDIYRYSEWSYANGGLVLSRLVPSLFLASLLLLGFVLPLVGATTAVVDVPGSAQMDTSPRHDLPIEIVLSCAEQGNGTGLVRLSAEATRTAYDGPAQLRLLVAPEGAAELISGEWNSSLGAEATTSYVWELFLLEGAQVTCRSTTLKGAVLGGDSILLAGGPSLPVVSGDGGVAQVAAMSAAAPAAPRTVLCPSATNFQSSTGHGRSRPTNAAIPRSRSTSLRGCGRLGSSM